MHLHVNDVCNFEDDGRNDRFFYLWFGVKLVVFMEVFAMTLKMQLINEALDLYSLSSSCFHLFVTQNINSLDDNIYSYQIFLVSD